MTTCLSLVAALWSYYEAWRNNSFKDTDSDGEPLRPCPSISRTRRVKDADYGTRMSLLNDYKHGSTAYAERKPSQ